MRLCVVIYASCFMLYVHCLVLSCLDGFVLLVFVCVLACLCHACCLVGHVFFNVLVAIFRLLSCLLFCSSFFVLFLALLSLVCFVFIFLRVLAYLCLQLCCRFCLSCIYVCPCHCLVLCEIVLLSHKIVITLKLFTEQSSRCANVVVYGRKP